MSNQHNQLPSSRIPPPPPPERIPRPPLHHPRGFPGFPGGRQIPLGELQERLKERFSFSRQENEDFVEDTDIMSAAYCGKDAQLESLIEKIAKGTNPDGGGGGGGGEDGRSRVVNELNKRNRFGCTALRLAATTGQPLCLTRIINEGADVDISDVKAQTPLFVAIANNHLQCAEILLKAGAHPDGNPDNLSTPLYMCANAGWLEGLELLIRWGASLNRPPYHHATFLTSPLHIALAYGNRHCFEALLLAGADPDHCCGGDDTEDGGDIPTTPSNQRVRPLRPPSRGGLAQLPLYHVARRHGRGADYLRLLFEFGADPWSRDEDGATALEARGYEQEGEVEIRPEEFLRKIMAAPRSLMSLCRLKIRSSVLGPDRLHRLHRLAGVLPPLLLDYIRYNQSSDVVTRYDGDAGEKGAAVLRGAASV